jgi:putative heme iron utilization protein
MSNHANGESAAQAARRIMRSTLKATLASLEPATGVPYASLVTVANGADGSPLMLLSNLAVHTRNLKADARASMLFDATDAAGDPLAGGRVTVIGRVARIEQPAHARQRFLSRLPEAELYADFPDFAFYRLAVERAHYIGGFGRIVDLEAADLLTEIGGAEALIAAEQDIVAHMNADHADAVALYATRLAGVSEGAWRMCGIDPAGLDMRLGGVVVRLSFEKTVRNPQAAREALVALAARARSA